MTDSEVSANAIELIQRSIVCDAIVPWTEYGDPSLRTATIDRYLAAGFNFVSLSLCSDEESTSDVLKAVAGERLNETNPRIDLVGNLTDVGKSASRESLAVSMNFQGTNCFGGDLRLVETFKALGVSQALLVYNKKNPVGDGCHERTNGGLSSYGLELVAEMNRTGMIVDCSHCGLQTSLEAIDTSSAPTVFSHSNAKALFEHDRNITDEQVRACADRGGWIGVNGLGIFMGTNENIVEKVFQHIDYYCELIGPRHVGLGTDFLYDIEDMRRYMRNINSPASAGYDNIGEQFEPELLPQVVERMLTAGYSNEHIRGILGANYTSLAARVSAVCG